MPKWLTAIFALFLSIQVFGARGKAVDRFLGSCFSPAAAARIQQPVSPGNTGFYRIKPARKARLMVTGTELFWSGEPKPGIQEKTLLVPDSPATLKH